MGRSYNNLKKHFTKLWVLCCCILVIFTATFDLYQKDVLATSSIQTSQFETPISLGPVTADFYQLPNGSTTFDPSLISSSDPLYTRDYPNINLNPTNTSYCSNQISTSTQLQDVVLTGNGTCGTLATAGHGFLASSCVQTSFYSVKSIDCGATDGQGDIYETNYNSWHPVRIDPGHALLSISCFGGIICFSGDNAGNVFETKSPNATFSSQIALVGKFSVYRIL